MLSCKPGRSPWCMVTSLTCANAYITFPQRSESILPIGVRPPYSFKLSRISWGRCGTPRCSLTSCLVVCHGPCVYGVRSHGVVPQFYECGYRVCRLLRWERRERGSNPEINATICRSKPEINATSLLSPPCCFRPWARFVSLGSPALPLAFFRSPLSGLIFSLVPLPACSLARRRWCWFRGCVGNPVQFIYNYGFDRSRSEWLL